MSGLLAEIETHSWWTVAGLLVVPALIALNAFFVAAEFALVAIRKTRVEELIKQGQPKAKSLLAAIEQLNDSVAAAQLGITLASLALGLVSEPAFARLLRPLFEALPTWWQGPVTHTLSIFITLLAITYLHVVFGEQMPKIAALQSTERIALWVARPLNAFARISRPLIRLMNGSSDRFLRVIGYRPSETDEDVHSVEELRLLIEDTEEAGLIDEEQADIVQNVFTLSNKTVRDIMIPREKMEVLDSGMNPEQIMAAVRAGAHTRMPVFDSSTDRVIGIVNTKDLFYLFSLRGVVLLDDALYPATYLDPDESVANALKLFKKSRKPMALVRTVEDKIIGLATLEDVVEEIVGDIEDEHDRPVQRLKLKPRRTGPLRKLTDTKTRLPSSPPPTQ